MSHRAFVIALLAVCGTAAAAGAQTSPTEASLKQAHETIVKSVQSGSLPVVQGMIHPQASGFFRDSQQIVQLGPSVTPGDVLATLVADLGHFVTTPTSTAYRVHGNVGIVNMTTFQERKRNERGSDRFVRGTYAYAWESGSWKLVSWHSSDTPLKK